MNNFSERIRKFFGIVPNFYKGKWDDAIDIKKNPITNNEKLLIPVVDKYLDEVSANAKMHNNKIPDGIAKQTSTKYADKCNMTEEQLTILVTRLKNSGLV